VRLNITEAITQF